jgi:hypothetical protein
MATFAASDLPLVPPNREFMLQLSQFGMQHSLQVLLNNAASSMVTNYSYILETLHENWYLF